VNQRQLEGLLTDATPFLDVRAPAEYATGALPGAMNLPLLNDRERHEVGLTYKEQGGSAAQALGEALVSGAVKDERIESWVAAASRHEDLWLYCWRGGLRSQIAQRWLAERGFKVPRVAGGFKALRNCCLSVLERAPDEKSWLVLAGRTGSGKTILIRERSDSIDLEGLANHRGSAFGAQPCGQPSPVSFENSLAVAFLRLPSERVVLEDESRTIGRLALPASWHQRMQQAPLVVLEKTLAERAGNIRTEYVDEPLAAGTPAADLLTRYSAALERIRKRLGGARCSEVAQSLARGFETGEHERWIEQLLSWYYDPMYDYQLEQKQQRVVARGNAEEVRAYLAG
jgi:tRNA 2-selenouridine synthase